MKNIHIIQTDKPSRLYKNISKELSFTSIEFTQKKGFNINQNIYITSDERIKEGDWCYNEYQKTIIKFSIGFGIGLCKKIILTTDQDLIKDGVQAIDDEFLEWFVKNSSCEEVEVVSAKTIPALQLTGNGHCWWKIIIPKEEPKQETLEEAAKNYIKLPLHKDIDEEERYYNPNIKSYDAFIEGAKWQAEKMYSKEEVMDMFHKFSMHLPLHYEFLVREQFKKK